MHSLDVRFGLEEITDCIEQSKLKWEQLVDLPELVSGKRRISIASNQSTDSRTTSGSEANLRQWAAWSYNGQKEKNIGFVVPQNKKSRNLCADKLTV